jgi:hypothetical protein
MVIPRGRRSHDLVALTGRLALLTNKVRNERGCLSLCSKREPAARKKAMPQEDFMSYPDYPASLRELVGHCRSAAKGSFELESKVSFRRIAERLSTIADEIEQSGNPRSGGTTGVRGAP